MQAVVPGVRGILITDWTLLRAVCAIGASGTQPEPRVVRGVCTLLAAAISADDVDVSKVGGSGAESGSGGGPMLATLMEASAQPIADI